MTGEERAYPLATLRARAAELERRITDAPDEDTARHAADELHALLDGDDQPRHPGWCSGGPQCWPPSAGGGVEGDRIVEVVHCAATYVEHVDGVAQVAVERFDTLHDDGRHDVEQVVYLNTDGTFSARQAEAYARAILQAVGAVDAGLEGTPGGIPAVLGALPEPWPPGRGARRGVRGAR